MASGTGLASENTMESGAMDLIISSVNTPGEEAPMSTSAPTATSFSLPLILFLLVVLHSIS